MDVLDVMINMPVIDKKEIRVVVKVLESGILTSATRLGSSAVCDLENVARSFVELKYAIAINSGTIALQHALYVSGIGPSKGSSFRHLLLLHWRKSVIKWI